MGFIDICNEFNHKPIKKLELLLVIHRYCLLWCVDGYKVLLNLWSIEIQIYHL